MPRIPRTPLAAAILLAAAAAVAQPTITWYAVSPGGGATGPAEA